ncbi:hypothetical protein HMPREF1544_11609 [Mucor circinelloides 1006PhL]|uniref:BZIP domain-containing protein n=1 Tax=Mucor circinelloides f. circinelloides (strain 1006PhL) TaxID=1220926 RepID=S2IWI7_MUCC1|nr:hypothetical protein HMPREF1544_11609 [Mucor circinelloides 1006PhL]
MSNANMIVKGDNSYSDLTDQELNNPHIQYVERPMMAPLEPWMAAANAPPPSANSQQQHYYNANENGSFLPTPPGSSHPRQSHQLQQLPQQQQQQQNSFANHEFMSNSSSNVPVNYQHSHQHHRHQVYSPSPSPPRYRQGSVASDSSNPSSTPYGELDEHSSQSSRNHAGGGGGGGTKMTVNKRDKALERNRQAALRCRQRKKEWLNQLQSNVDVLTKENRALEQQSLTLREEILNLKTVLLAHRDCSHAHLTASSINFDTLLYRPTSNSNAVGAHTSPNSTTPI